MGANFIRHRNLSLSVVSALLVGLLIFWAAPFQHSAKAKTAFATITVNTTADTTTADGFCSLREAIQAANTNAAVNECTAGTVGTDTIQFNLGGGTPTINVTSALPTITDPVVINGNTGGATRVELNGAGAGSSANGLLISAGGSTVQSLVINRFSANGIVLQIGAGNTVRGCIIGLNAAGTVDQGNTNDGISINSANNIIGGTTAGDRNIISGNNASGVGLIIATTTGNLIQGNFIGTDINGTADLGNSGRGIIIFANANGNTIGGLVAGARNVISGNDFEGVLISGTNSNNNRIEGNYIGTDASGTADLGNSFDGVAVRGGANNVVGGTAAGAGNLISGNNTTGVIISTSTTRVEGNFIGTDATGTADLGNSLNGVLIEVSNNVIGGTTAGARNVISGNNLGGVQIINAASANNIVQGNFIGTDSSGTADLGNTSDGVRIDTGAHDNLIGGTAAGARNVISGNNGDGIEINGTMTTANLIQGNFIGTNVAGTAALGNSLDGIRINGANNVIGGTTASHRNIISGNNGDGIKIIGTTATGNFVRGNFIGTDAAGTARVGNNFGGVVIDNAPNNTIGGMAAGAGNVISGNSTAGNFNNFRVFGSGASGNIIQGNIIGLNAAGTAAIPGGASGLWLADFGSGGPTNTLIGGTTAGARNIISGNGTNGIRISNATVTNNTVQGNFIGTQINGTVALGNATDGIRIDTDAHDNLIGGTTAGAANVIAFNNQRGISVNGTVAVGNAILANSIFANSSLGIDLGTDSVTANDTGDGDSGPNQLQNFPILTSAAANATNTAVSGTLNSSANTTFTIQFFSNTACDSSGNGEGQMFLGQTQVTTDASGNATINVTLPTGAAVGSFITATATDAANNTSEFSPCRVVSCSLITISPATLPAGTMGTAYSQTFTQTGGSGIITWSVSAGALPPNLTLEETTGVLSGTPTANGSFGFTIQATDVNGCLGTQAYTLLLHPPCPTITVNPATLAPGLVGTAYNQTLTATGGTAPHTFAVTTGSLPMGLNLASGGALMGTPNTAGTFTFTVTATDNTGCTGTRTYTVIVSGNGLQFYPLPAPVRLLDTRPGASPNACSQPDAPITGQTARTQPGRNLCTIPANAQALTGNVTTVQSGGGFLTLYPSDATQPTVASTNYGVNAVINNVFTVGLGADGAFKIFANNTTDVVVDVTGYYAPPATGGLYFHPLPAPVRLLETRAGQPVGCVKPGMPLTGGADSVQTATTACTGIPLGARSVVGNATTVGPAGVGYLTLYPADVANAPLVASSNYNTNQVVNGPFTVGLSAAGQFKIFTTQTTDLVVDVLGYYSPEANDANGAGLLFTPLPKPVRLLETRPGLPVGCFKPGVPLAGGTETTQMARGLCDGVTIPTNALGVVGNATVVFPQGLGFLTLWPSTAVRPTVATSNYNAGDIGNRHFIVGLGNGDGAFKIYTQATTDLVIDLSGYFAP